LFVCLFVVGGCVEEKFPGAPIVFGVVFLHPEAAAEEEKPAKKHAQRNTHAAQQQRRHKQHKQTKQQHTQHTPFQRMRPSSVSAARAIWPLYSTVKASSAGSSRPSSMSARSVTTPAGRLGGRLAAAGAAGLRCARAA
jgi:hypothetical protein